MIARMVGSMIGHKRDYHKRVPFSKRKDDFPPTTALTQSEKGAPLFVTHFHLSICVVPLLPLISCIDTTCIYNLMRVINAMT